MCTCNFGKIHLDPTEGDYVCGCVEGQALQGRSCVPCLELHLNCSAPSAVAAKAPPLRGWARLEPATERTFRCLEPAEDRCRNGTALSACATGYDGPLCVICAPGFRSAGSLCKPCANFRQSRRGVLAFGAALSVAALVAGVVLWRRRAELAALAAPASPPREPRARDAVLQLLCTAGPLLLQLGQLWVVVSALAMGARVESRVQEAEERSFSEAFKEQPYVQWLQLSAQGLQTALSLECSFGSVARTWAALVEPLAPLLLLALCGVVELFFRSAGIDLALKTVTLLFVGGATGCGNLLGCQEDDGGGNPLGKHHAFRVAMPELKCSDATWVTALGWLCAFAYGVLIPICLLGLMMKQHVTLQACRKTTAWAIKEGDRLVVRLHEFQGNAKAAAKDVPKEGGASEPRKLLAAAVAHAVVLFRGKVRMQMDDGGVTLELVQASENVAEPYDFSDMLLEIKSSSNAQRCNAITRMLMERSILEEAEKSDRVLAGARGHLAKYVWCQDVWVDIMMRLATVGLVSACSMEHSLGFSVGIPLVVGIMVGALQPYVQRQVQSLRFCAMEEPSGGKRVAMRRSRAWHGKTRGFCPAGRSAERGVPCMPQSGGQNGVAARRNTGRSRRRGVEG
ncbi:unnamed protein product [Effrenium voratum]|nr:unnamed protein product [Effrenium voratum]